MNKKYLTEIVFQVDDVQSSFYFNANISYVQRNNISKTKRFRDVMFNYSESQTLYSTDFTNLTLEISIKCKPGFYPKLKCTVPCFDNPPIYKCNELGEKICLKEELQRYSGESNCINPIAENQVQSFGTGFSTIAIIVVVIIVILVIIACVSQIFCPHKHCGGNNHSDNHHCDNHHCGNHNRGNHHRGYNTFWNNNWNFNK